MPEDYVRTKTNIGIALGVLAEMTREQSFMEEAVTVYREALDVSKSTIEPAYETKAQVKLENALRDVGTVFDDAEYREDVVSACRKVMKSCRLEPNCPSCESIKTSLSHALEVLGVRTCDSTSLLEAKALLLKVQEVRPEEKWLDFRLEQLDIAITNAGGSSQ